jgi:uncharacterized protein YecE (DUF72 family)
VTATVRLGTCSWADEGLLQSWYPRGVSTAEKRLRYYAERFDTVEIDSPFYALPDPDVARRWAERTPAGFVFHAKASKGMTHHETPERGLEHAVAEFRGALEPLELAGKLRGVLLQYHPRFKKSDAAKKELSGVAPLLEPLVPLVEFRHGSWMEDDEQEDTLAFLERHGLAYVSVDSPMTRATNVLPRVAAATHRVAYVRFHGRNWRTWNIRGARKSWERFDWQYTEEELGEWVAPVARLAEEADEVYAMFNVNRDDQGPRSAAIFRDLLDGAGIPAAGGVEPPPVELTLF